VAELVDVYGRLAEYTNVLSNVQPSQTRNALALSFHRGMGAGRRV
jgi:hypothetical protein